MSKIEFGDCRETMRRWAAEGVKVQTCVTSPPYYGPRDYGHEGQIGLEQTPEEYIAAMVEVFRCVRDVLADDGTLWLNIGDTYSTHASSSKAHSHNFRSAKTASQNGIGTLKKNSGGLPEKNLMGIPWRLAFALQADGWILRNDIIWHKPNPTPGGQGKAFDRFTVSHEYIFFFAKCHKYFFDGEAVRTDTNARPKDVWRVTTRPYKGAHFATFPPALIEPCILSGSRYGDIVLDPFIGSGTTAQVAIQHGRQYLGCELNPEYKALQDERIAKAQEAVTKQTAQLALC